MDKLISQIFGFSRVLREQIHSGETSKDIENCSFLHIKTLDFIADKKQPSMKEVAENLHIASPTATSIINRLVKNGDLLRINDPTDRRIVRLKITVEGKKRLLSGIKKVKINMKKVLNILTLSEQTELEKILEKIIKNHNSEADKITKK